jgi:hypothetical protein
MYFSKSSLEFQLDWLVFRHADSVYCQYEYIKVQAIFSYLTRVNIRAEQSPQLEVGVIRGRVDKHRKDLP